MSFDPGDIRILLAAATPRVQVAAKRVLIEEGYRVVSAVDGQAALEVIDENPPDLLITAIDLPHARGPEVAERLRAHAGGRPAPCLFLVQAADERVFETGEWDLILHLPFAATELIDRVRALVDALERKAPPVTEVPVHVPQVAWQYELEHAGEHAATPPPPSVDFDLDAPDAPEPPPASEAGAGDEPPPRALAPAEAPADLPATAAPAAEEVATALLERLPAGLREGDLAEHDLGALLIAAADAGFTGTLH
ncbi:MAG: response regulator, partial [Deltaproteobacteria bacterium]